MRGLDSLLAMAAMVFLASLARAQGQPAASQGATTVQLPARRHSIAAAKPGLPPAPRISIRKKTPPRFKRSSGSATTISFSSARTPRMKTPFSPPSKKAKNSSFASAARPTW